MTNALDKFEVSRLARVGCTVLTPSITSGIHLSSRPVHPSSRPSVCGTPSPLASGPANRHCLGS